MGVVLLLFHLHPNPSLNLIYAGAFHDAGELKAGDMPYPVKRDNPTHYRAHAKIEERMAEEMGFKAFDLTEIEKLWLHLADRLESLLYMSLYGELTQWGQNHFQEVVEIADSLGCGTKVEKLMEDINNG